MRVSKDRPNFKKSFANYPTDATSIQGEWLARGSIWANTRLAATLRNP